MFSMGYITTAKTRGMLNWITERDLDRAVQWFINENFSKDYLAFIFDFDSSSSLAWNFFENIFKQEK